MNPFEIKDCALVSRMSGLMPAVNLRELRDRIASCHTDVLYHHYCETPLATSFDLPDFRNDFAVWAKSRLGDDLLAERLGIVDPYSFPTMDDLRSATIEIIDDRLSEVTMIPWARPGHEFHFMQAVTIVFDTGNQVSHPDGLASAVSAMTNSSVYFHVLEAQRRNAARVDDFTAWLQSLDGEWSHYVQATRSIDIGFLTLPELRKKLIEVLSSARNLDPRGESS